jgi:hypothetical protein
MGEEEGDGGRNPDKDWRDENDRPEADRPDRPEAAA